MVTIILRGGPDGLHHVQQAAIDETSETAVVTYYGHHLHFERTGEVETVEGRQVPVFQWRYSTAIAE
ncbi:DUF5988 family protein [Streptomyces sp. BE20]|uniref:DUF5988 family protein n=1 Tax=Streptomycetaceae TaxID=2062 RepID=UPI002E75A0AC|nr:MULTISPECIES: DUF5988 family protein [unclassified Streptomyces]MED7950948.1 DUF5988 family protein [Streptomyces sp. BE303]MEE1825190.1 DUF5988 family protein [Streptomyces sp. BE20]